MADSKKNPLIGAFRAPVPGTPPTDKKPAPPPPSESQVPEPTTPEKKRDQAASEVPANAPAKPADEKKEPGLSKPPADSPTKPVS